MHTNDLPTINTNETDATTVITGYEAELIKLQAERVGKTPEEFLLSFFEVRCIAPNAAGEGRRLNNSRRVSFCR